MSTEKTSRQLYLWILDVLAQIISRVPFMFRGFKKIVLNECIFPGIAEDSKTRLLIEFQTVWEKLDTKLHFNKKNVVANLPIQQNSIWQNGKSVKNAILDLICNDQIVLLQNGSIRYSDRDSLWILLNELFINEEYFFPSENSNPRILDCGSHFGLATIYFKMIYPNARITLFEPIQDIREMAQLNVDENRLTDVEVLPYALSGTEGMATFYVSRERPMGSSLTNRYKLDEDTIIENPVECRKLSNYLNEPVNFLKLDIEGAEYDVVNEIQDKLQNVEYMFCECHMVDEKSGEKLAELLRVLSMAGFDYRCTNSWTTEVRTACRPMTFTGEPLSSVVWARNRNWKK